VLYLKKITVFRFEKYKEFLVVQKKSPQLCSVFLGIWLKRRTARFARLRVKKQVKFFEAKI